MTPPVVFSRPERSSLRSKCPLSRLLTFIRLIFHPDTSLKGTNPTSCPIDGPVQSELLPPEFDLSPQTDPNTLCEHLVGLVCRLRSLLPDSCRWFGQGALEFVGEHPIDTGGTADVWAGKMGHRTVAIKAYRCYSSTDCGNLRGEWNLPAVSDRLKSYWQRFYKEALACSCLKDESIAPFIGVFSTPEYPLALVFDFMAHLNLREYLRNHEGAGRSKLVRFRGQICPHWANIPRLAFGNSTRGGTHTRYECRPWES